MLVSPLRDSFGTLACATSFDTTSADIDVRLRGHWHLPTDQRARNSNPLVVPYVPRHSHACWARRRKVRPSRSVKCSETHMSGAHSHSPRHFHYTPCVAICVLGDETLEFLAIARINKSSPLQSQQSRNNLSQRMPATACLQSWFHRYAEKQHTRTRTRTRTNRVDEVRNDATANCGPGIS